MIRSFRSLAAAGALVFSAVACADSPTAAAVRTDADAADLRPGPQTIVGIALGNPDFSTLVAAVVAADLVDALNGDRQLTVFAPTNAAFAALGLNADNVGDLPKDALTDILLYHVTPGRRIAKSVVNTPRLQMLNGDAATISRSAGSVRINESTIAATDISARNGIVHVIDAVLLPPSE
jgi:uncharacterized surface protein with fasciclin (FAS1) repeats